MIERVCEFYLTPVVGKMMIRLRQLSKSTKPILEISVDLSRDGPCICSERFAKSAGL